MHVATPDFAPLRWREDKKHKDKDADKGAFADGGGVDTVDDGIAPRLVQAFLYWRDDLEVGL